MKNLIAIAFFVTSFSANAQSYSPLADSVILSKDSLTAYLSMVQLSSTASSDFYVGTQFAGKIPFTPMYHWENYVRDTYDNADSVTCSNRDNTSHYTGKPVKIRTFRFWKNGEEKRWISYIFIDDELTKVVDSNLGGYHSTFEEVVESQKNPIFREFTAKRKL